jgi:hypothetical protein
LTIPEIINLTFEALFLAYWVRMEWFRIRPTRTQISQLRKHVDGQGKDHRDELRMLSARLGELAVRVERDTAALERAIAAHHEEMDERRRFE